ncbi:MAG TPA: DUF58 domain-containing protein [Candidatus Acidoferrales bacterium]|nr:DUF58 domain-containing protein [Candidatus Acidoferrales bacterium]
MLSAAELTLLGRLDLARRRPLSGMYAGERRSPRAARSPEFADFRPYSPGDDFRQIDWRAFARLERLMLRLYVAEEESSLNVVVDTSGSMALGSPPKWPAARKLAAAVTFLGLAAMDRVAAGVLGGSAHTPHLRGRDGAGRLLSFLQRLEPGGSAGPGDLPGLRWPRPGLTVIISDFLNEEPWGSALAGLRHRRQEPVLWQVLAPDEEAPGLRGDLKLVDVESEAGRELTVTPSLVQDYLQALQAHRERLRRAAGGAWGRFLHSGSQDDLEASMLAGLRAGVVTRS